MYTLKYNINWDEISNNIFSKCITHKKLYNEAIKIISKLESHPSCHLCFNHDDIKQSLDDYLEHKKLSVIKIISPADIKNKIKHINLRIANNIIEFREEFKLTRKALGDTLGVTQQQIAKYETGIDRISICKLLLICETYNVNLNRFIEYS